MKKKIYNFSDLIKHIAVIILLTIGLVYSFFNIYLPISTNQGDTVSVPELKGMMYSEMDEFLSKRNLRYEIEEDSSYSAKYPPLTVLKQFPLANSKVKENRRIYLTLNTSKPPLVKLPILYGLSLKSAILELNSLGFVLGKTTYIPASHLNTIVSMSINEVVYKGGEMVEQGSKIDFVLTDGLGNTLLKVPNLVGLDLDEAKAAIFGSGLNLRNAYYKKKDKILMNDDKIYEKKHLSNGKVFKQNPDAGEDIKIGTSIDIWIMKMN